MDQCRLLDWTYHEDWVQWLLQALTKDVPTGFASIKLDQILRADKELWTILAQQQTKSLRPESTSVAVGAFMAVGALGALTSKFVIVVGLASHLSFL
jgi:uncharacterized protein (DUF2062 family)